MARILIIEDDFYIKKAYTNILTKENFEVETAEDGEEGLIKAESYKPDLILLDILMPKMDGIEFLKKYDIKNNHPDVKVIIFSNMSLQNKVDEAIQLGATNYTTKAFYSPKEMIKLIRDTLNIDK